MFSPASGANFTRSAGAEFGALRSTGTPEQPSDFGQPSSSEPFTMRIVTLDHYTAPPLSGVDAGWSELEGSGVSRVPVVRIFGTTPAGQKACLHLHGAFPYLYVPYEDDLPQDPARALAYINRLAYALNVALSMRPADLTGLDHGTGVNSAPPQAQRRDQDDSTGSLPTRQRIYAVSLVRAFAFYGYHPTERVYVKILLYEPKDVSKAASLLLSGAILGRKWQPHESHVPYLLQLKVDLNLHGMGWLNLSHVRFRGPMPSRGHRHRAGWARLDVIELQEPFQTCSAAAKGEKTTSIPSSSADAANAQGDLPSSSSPTSYIGVAPPSRLWLAGSVPYDMLWGGQQHEEGGPPRQTTCELELDAHVENVLNRRDVNHLPLHQAGEDVRLVDSLGPMWDEERKRCGGITPSPPPEKPRTPSPLGPNHLYLRRQFIAAEDAQLQKLQPQMIHAASARAGIHVDAACDNRDLNDEKRVFAARAVDQLPTRQEATGALLAGTQAANEASLPSQTRSVIAPAGDNAMDALTLRPGTAPLPGVEIESQRRGAMLEDGKEDYQALIDRTIMATQMRLSQGNKGRENYELYPEEDDHAAFGVHDEGDIVDTRGDGQEQDWLMQLAMQISPTQQDQIDTPMDHAGDAGTESQVFRGQTRDYDGITGADSSSAHKVALPELHPETAPHAATHSRRAPLGEDYMGSSQQQAYLRAQAALEQFLEATQQECDDILEASSIPKGDVQDGEHAAHQGQDLDIVGRRYHRETAAEPEQNVQSLAPAIVPQTDGAASDDDADEAMDNNRQIRTNHLQMNQHMPRYASNIDDKIQDDDTEFSQHDDGNKNISFDVAHEGAAAALPRERERAEQPVDQGPKSVAYASRDQIKAASSILLQAHRMLSPTWLSNSDNVEQKTRGDAAQQHLAHDTENSHPTARQSPAEAGEALSRQQHGVPLLDVGPEALPPTQPLTNDANNEEAADVPPTQPIVPSSPPHACTSSPGSSEHMGRVDAAAWWREEVSQVPFEDLEWDMMDDEEQHVDDGVHEHEQARAYGTEEQHGRLKTDGRDAESFDVDPGSNALGAVAAGGDDMPDTLNRENSTCFVHDVIVEDQGETDGGKLTLLRFQRDPPAQQALLDSCWDVGILPLVHAAPHYSDPSHVPPRPVTFAGKEHRVPSTAVQDLPAFTKPTPYMRPRMGGNAAGIPGDAGPLSLLRAQVRLHHQAPGNRSTLAIESGNGFASKSEGDGLLAFVPARRPPSLVATDQWLAVDSCEQSLQRRGSSSGRGTFVLDPNTGKLVPASSSQGKEELGGGMDDEENDDLMVTPSLASARLSGGEAAGTPVAAIGIRGVNVLHNNEEDGSERIHPRPASPKYDDRTFFYSNPYATVTKDTPSFVRGTGTGPIASAAVAAVGHPRRLHASDARQSTNGECRDTPARAQKNTGGTAFAAEQLKTTVNVGNDTDNATMIENQRANFERSTPRTIMKSSLKRSNDNGASGDVASQGSRGKKVAFVAAEAPPAEQLLAQVVQPGQSHAQPERCKPSDTRPGAPPLTKAAPPNRSQYLSLITPPTTRAGGGDTPSSQLGFKRTVAGKGQGLTLASVEVHVQCRGQLLPDPRLDAIRGVVIAIMDDNEEVLDGKYFVRILLFDGPVSKEENKNHVQVAGSSIIAPLVGSAAPPPTAVKAGTPVYTDALIGSQIERFSTEVELLDATVAAIQALDPDILMGYEVQQGSLGYLAERAAAAFDRHKFLREISRLPGVSEQQRDGPAGDAYGWNHASGLHVAGRIVLNVWRLMRSEIKLNIYTLENCAAAVLRLRVPHIPPRQLSAWFEAGPSGGRWRTLSHISLRARLSLMLLDRLDLVGRTSELARCFGIDFFSVLSRGSQYRVESMTLRLAHSQNYLALSPSAEQVARQPAMEALPLILEPRSAMYPDPVCVLDFQSLYPSMIIAYNLCYSTCVGRVAHSTADEPIKLGCSKYAAPTDVLAGGRPGARGLAIAPNGVAFVPVDVRPGVLPRLLREILETRIMVKGAMKRAPLTARVLLRCLNARQFGLKLIANVTYGYTAAGFSGRMPMAELADAIVQSARETLEAAIRLVESVQRWRAKVVYGDTDSLFVQLPGRTVAEAFEIGAEIAAAVTAANPPPVVLKLEKVYHPCVLLSKKRYAGAMYESPSQIAPTFDAKGIETVRRDSCPAVAKIMERSLRLLFASADLSTLRHYLQRQWTRILANRVSIADFVFAKEVRLGTYSARAGIIPPAALVATRAMAADPRAEPRYGERVPYVVIYGEPGARLVDMVVPPRALVESSGRLRLHALYYITKQINPALERVLSLVGADVKAWFAEMPRPARMLPQKRSAATLGLENSAGQGGRNAQSRTGGATTIDRFYLSRHCAVCDELTHASRPLCERCTREPQLAAGVLSARLNRLERQYVQLLRVCLACGGGGGTLESSCGGRVACDSLDCGVYFERRKVWWELQTAEALATAGLRELR